MSRLFDSLRAVSKRMGISKEEVPFDPAVFNDLLALRISWSPLKRGGASFRTHRLVQKNPDRWEFRATFGALLFGLVFGGFGIMGIGMGVGFLAAFEGVLKFSALIGFLVGSVFLAASIWMLRSFSQPIVFDARNGWFWKGREDPESAVNRNDLKCFAELEEIHALQLISEHCSGNDSSYYSYELNLVLESGERLNVFDHGSLKKAREDAEKLGRFLGCPVWGAVRG